VHVSPQSIPAGELETLPEPLPLLDTVKSCVCSLKVAVTDLAAFIVTVHPPVPVQSPDQPANSDPAAAVAVSVTDAPCANECVQVPPQSIPAGELETLPDPVPLLDTVKSCGGTALNVAVTDLAASIVTVHPPVPVQSPDQPANSEPTAAVAVSVTDVPWSYECVHVLPQSIPAGELETPPEPVPLLDTVRTCVCSVNVALTNLARVM
jgi:hypothetical protein